MYNFTRSLCVRTRANAFLGVHYVNLGGKLRARTRTWFEVLRRRCWQSFPRVCVCIFHLSNFSGKSVCACVKTIFGFTARRWTLHCARVFANVRYLVVVRCKVFQLTRIDNDGGKSFAGPTTNGFFSSLRLLWYHHLVCSQTAEFLCHLFAQSNKLFTI